LIFNLAAEGIYVRFEMEWGEGMARNDGFDGN
jgi:hypothetical protein